METLVWILFVLFWACLFWVCILGTIYVALKINYKKWFPNDSISDIINASEKETKGKGMKIKDLARIYVGNIIVYELMFPKDGPSYVVCQEKKSHVEFSDDERQVNMFIPKDANTIYCYVIA